MKKVAALHFLNLHFISMNETCTIQNHECTFQVGGAMLLLFLKNLLEVAMVEEAGYTKYNKYVKRSGKD